MLRNLWNPTVRIPTTLVGLLLVAGALSAQDRLADLPARGGSWESESQDPPPPLGGLTFYGDRQSFNAANPGLIVEDWEDFLVAPGDVVSCDAPADALTSCPGAYASGSIVPGLELRDLPGPSLNALAVLGAGFNGNASIQFGTNYVDELLFLQLSPPVSAIGMDVACHVNPATATVVVFDDIGAELGTTVSDCSNAGTFLGISSTAPIGFLSIESDTNQHEFIANVALPSPTASHPLFAGHSLFSGDEVPYLFDPADGELAGVATLNVLGAAWDPFREVLYLSAGPDVSLYSWTATGGLVELGEIQSGGSELTALGLAFYGGQLFLTESEFEAIYVVDLETLEATPHIFFLSEISLGGLAADPTTGEFYGTEDLVHQALVRINAAGTVTVIADYLGDEDDVDGLAISWDRKAYLITDDETPPEFQVYDLELGAYESPVPSPFEAGVHAGGAWVGPVPAEFLEIFADGFESGDTSQWSVTIP